MNRDVFKVINESTTVEFEAALNEGGVEGFKIVPLTVSFAPGRCSCIMGKTIDPETGEVKERARKANLFVPENYGV